MTKMISEATALQARGLFELGRQHYKKMRDVERALHELLNYDDDYGVYCGCLSDELYDEESGNFDKGIKNDGFTVRDAVKPRRR